MANKTRAAAQRNKEKRGGINTTTIDKTEQRKKKKLDKYNNNKNNKNDRKQHKKITNQPTNLVEEVVPEELENVTLARLRPLPSPLVRPLVQSAELQEQPQQPTVVVLALQQAGAASGSGKHSMLGVAVDFNW